MPLGPTQLTIDADFQVSNANIFARLSAAAYCAPLSIKDNLKRLDNWTCQACIDSGVVMAKTTPFRIAAADLYGYVSYNADVNTVVVVFTGSQSIVNWIYNLDAAFIDFPGIPEAFVHKGFFTAWQAARPTIIAMIDAVLYEHPTATVSFPVTLSAVRLQLFTYDLSTSAGYQIFNFGPEGSEPIIVGGNLFDTVSLPNGVKPRSDAKFTSKYKLNGATYTFGSPRVGNNVMSNYFIKVLGKQQIFRMFFSSFSFLFIHSSSPPNIIRTIQSR
jgi:hypothetical protein